MSVHKFYLSIYNVQGVPTALGFEDSAINALQLGHFTEQDFDKYNDDLEMFINILSTKMLSNEPGFEDVTIPGTTITISVPINTITTIPEYNDFYSFVASFPDEWKVGSEFPNSWVTRLMTAPNHLYTVGWYGHVQL